MSQIQAVGADTGAGATSLSFTVSSTTAGHQLVILLYVTSIGITISSVSDGHSGTWTERGAGANCHCVDSLNCAGSITTVTVNFSASAIAMGFIMERDDITGFDQIVSQNTQTSVTTWTSNTSAAMAQNTEIGFGWAGSTAGQAQFQGAGTGWSNLTGTNITSGTHDNTTDGDSLKGEFQVFTSGGTTSASGACSSTANPLSRLVLYTQPSPDVLMGQACL